LATFEFILLLAAAVLISSVIEQVLPRISLPLVQIALGLVLVLLLGNSANVTFNPSFFLFLFVAPLLYNDAREADKVGLWRNRTAILSLAIGLVIAIMLAVGFTLHLLVPSIPLAAAFALGAALGPTDAVAVTALKGTADLERREAALLSGEALINDATGVVSFQFAVAAAVTGSFSLLDASENFVLSFFGGILLGILFAFLAYFVLNRIGNSGLESTTFHVLFDVLLPFLVFFTAETCHVSGILAVVATGLVMSGLTAQVIGPASSRLNIVSTSVWKVLTFTLNGIVFVMLGMQLPGALQSTWGDLSIDNLTIIGYVFALTAVLVGVRFIWVFLMDRLRHGRPVSDHPLTLRESAHSALVATCGGPKGAVTLSIIFSLPYLVADGSAFPQRELIIFLASGIILLTLIIANFALPLLAPQTDEKAKFSPADIANLKIEVMRQVISSLLSARTEENATATRVVVKAYSERIDRIRARADIERPETTKLRIDVLRHQQDLLVTLIERGEVDEVAATDEIRRLARKQNLLRHREKNRWVFIMAISHFATTLRVTWRSIAMAMEQARGGNSDEAVRHVRAIAERCAVNRLRHLRETGEPAYPPESVNDLLMIHLAALRAAESAETGSETTAFGAIDHLDKVQRFAYHLEIEQIQNAYESGVIPRSVAKEMHDNVYLMLVDLEGDI